MLLLLLVIPLLGVLLISQIEGANEEQNSRLKQIALITTIVNFIFSFILWLQFDSNSSQYQFTSEWNQISFGHLHLGVDNLSLYFILLTTFTFPICILSSWNNVQYMIKYYLISLLILETLIIGVFVVLDLLLFYVFFESVLIPLFFIVGIWGGSETKVRASFLLFLYTLFGSLFMLLAFVSIIYYVGSSNFDIISLIDINYIKQKILWIAIFISFAIKTPLVPFHIWLKR